MLPRWLRDALKALVPMQMQFLRLRFDSSLLGAAGRLLVVIELGHADNLRGLCWKREGKKCLLGVPRDSGVHAGLVGVCRGGVAGCTSPQGSV